MQEKTTSRMTAADSSYGEFYDFYVSPENFGSTHVYGYCLSYLLLVQLYKHIRGFKMRTWGIPLTQVSRITRPPRGVMLCAV